MIGTIPPYRPDVRCRECGEAFTEDEWETRHWQGDDRADVHDTCCQHCNDDGDNDDNDDNDNEEV